MQVDALVIGAGVMGASTAWQLARRGHSVLMAEQFPAHHAHGSSHGVVRIFRLAYADVHYVRMAQAALPLWHELEGEAGQHFLEHTGALDHGAGPTVPAIAAALAAAGAVHEELSPDAAAERFAGLRFDRYVVHHPDGGRVFAQRYLQAAYDAAQSLGAVTRFSCPASIVHVDGDGADVRLAPAEGDPELVRARTVIVTAGNWVAHVLRDLAQVSLPPLMIDHERVLHFAPLDAEASWPSFLHHVDPWRYGLHTPGEGLKIGGLREPIRALAADGRPLPVVHPDPANLERARQHAREWVPGVDPEPIPGPTCSFTSTRTRDFVLDRVGPVVVGSPCSDHGFKFAPLIGALLADLADGTTPRFDLARHRLDAFR